MESLRTCVVCGRKADRSGMLRFVAGADAVVWDATRCASGRGAWCCPEAACRERLPAMGKRLARVLRLKTAMPVSAVIA
ncbi:MAG: hypothetical protein BWK76_02675 [Desulfobulbaceae bacterium A2]|jgi:predicted RNA-binding protein YlxR (DUF448 family)|nr:MAG: hypothetical protein BWK76_02675 [Desulfobulbaceae bacterium A2]